MFQPTIDAVVRGDPEAILLVEFGEDDQDENLRRLRRLNELMGDLGFAWDKTGAKWGGVVEVLDPAAAGRDHRGAHRRPQHHDVDEGGGQTGLLRRGLRGAARASRRIHRAAHRDLREARHARHLVRACLGRLPACAAGAQPAARQGRQGDARDRRGSLRHGARLQGLAFRRAWRRHRALGIPRDDVRPAARARVRGGEGRASIRTACSIPARSCARRNSTTARCFRYGPDYHAEEIDDASRLVGLSGRRRRFPGRGRDVQQQRRLPHARRRRDVPELSRHPRRARRHARARQYAAARHHRPARARCARPPTRWRRR